MAFCVGNVKTMAARRSPFPREASQGRSMKHGRESMVARGLQGIRSLNDTDTSGSCQRQDWAVLPTINDGNETSATPALRLLDPLAADYTTFVSLNAWPCQRAPDAFGKGLCCRHRLDTRNTCARHVRLFSDGRCFLFLPNSIRKVLGVVH